MLPKADAMPSEVTVSAGGRPCSLELAVMQRDLVVSAYLIWGWHCRLKLAAIPRDSATAFMLCFLWLSLL